MAIIRGFVEALGVGRAGLVEATVLHGDGSTATYTIADLDADPERFNERLSKLGILRDAMDRAEPVEIAYPDDGEGGRRIESVKRLTRDALARPANVAVASGIVVGVAVEFDHNIGPRGETTDRATLALLSGGGVEIFVVPLQAPERGVALAAVEIAREAQRAGAAVQITYDTERRYVVQIDRSDLGGFGNDAEEDQFSAFVEEITHAPVTNLMIVSVTTAPEFAAAGNVVPLVGFTPELRHLAVVHGAPEYALLEAALRDKLRVRLMTIQPGERDKEPDSSVHPNEPANEAVLPKPIRSAAVGMSNAATMSRIDATRQLPAVTYLVRGATLQHALCSASRPVWIDVNRRALDVGPDEECMEGLPSSDLRPQSIRELNLPYRAAWVGLGCFNHGVYRIQLRTDRAFTILVDGELICVHYDEDGTTAFGHACLDGDHELQVLFENWQCRAKFDIDVYRIR